MRKTALLAVVSVLSLAGWSQDQGNDGGTFTGNIETTFQYLNEDTIIGADQPAQKGLMNSYMNVFYTKKNFKAGMRLESYLPRIQGYPTNFDGTGIGMRYVGYANDFIDVTLGSFYEQFGSGLSLRSYEDRALGYDNMLDGMRVILRPKEGVTVKGIYGYQRFAFQEGRIVHSQGIVRGADVEVNLNQSLKKYMSNSKLDVTLGGSLVSKYQRDNNSDFILRENVGCYGGRAALRYGKFTLDGEYVIKEQDPSEDNGYIYNWGHAGVINAGYSQKGLGIVLQAKSVDNMSYRSDRTKQLQDVLINFLPAMTKTHTYNLVSSLYPYATQPVGEIAYQGEILYTIKRGTKLGGKYGTSINVNYSTAYRPKRGDNMVQDSISGRMPNYSINPFQMSDSIYWSDFNINIYKKFSKKFNLTLSYFNMLVNNDVATVAKEVGNIKSNIFVVEGGFKFKNKSSMRVELQGLFVNRRDSLGNDTGFSDPNGTPVDNGDWVTLLVEYTINKNWFVSAMNQYNFGNGNLSKIKEGKKASPIHHPYLTVGYVRGATRLTASYGRQRAGLFCVGGVCRPVPASNGLTLSFTQSF